MNRFFPPEPPGHATLRRLAWMRVFGLSIEIALVLVAGLLLGIELPERPLASILGLQGVAVAGVFWRLKRPAPVQGNELYLHPGFDLLALTALLDLTGGPTNPFVSLYLLPLVVSAMTLPPRYSWTLGLITLACYSFLMFHYTPLHLGHSQGMVMAGHDHLFDLHVGGMWLGFVISLTILLVFIVKMASTVRDRESALTRIREDNLRDEQIIALATLSASAAHELGTPLSTMAVVVGELAQDPAQSSAAQRDYVLLQSQIASCRRILDRMLANSAHKLHQSPRDFLQETLYEWGLHRPQIPCRFTCEGGESPIVDFDPTVRSALLNLLNNAADASPQSIEIDARCGLESLILTIRDQGPGLTPEAYDQAGSAFYSTKEDGRGLGLLLANASINRHGGAIRLTNRESGGTTAEVTLPYPAVGT